MNTDECRKIFDIGFVCPTRARVVDVGEPFDFGRDVGESLELGVGQPANDRRVFSIS
jgi:hypothetical protein